MTAVPAVSAAPGVTAVTAVPAVAEMNCSQCEHPSCPHSLLQRGICSCPQADCRGTIVLDVLSKPKWKLDCNLCNFQLTLPEIIHSKEKRKERTGFYSLEENMNVFKITKARINNKV